MKFLKCTAVMLLKECHIKNTKFLMGKCNKKHQITNNKFSTAATFKKNCTIFFQSPGNHEFDDGVSGYVPFLKNVTFPIICANIDVSNEPT